MKKEAILQVNGIYKSFGVVKALKDVSISFLPGEIHGLIGENGSGKSTLSSIISGIYSCNQGEMILDGKVYKPTSIMDGEKHGICMIVQEMGTIGGITVAANVFAGKEELFSRLGIVNRKAMNRAAQEALDKIGASYIKAENKIDEESFENRKIVEIARAMFNDVKVLIIDETTTALSQKGRELIYQIMDRLKDENKVVIFISHDLDELTEHCNTVTVLRDGVYIKTLHGEEIQPDVMRQLMIGREVQDNYYRDDYDDYRGGEDVITVENVCTEGGLKNVSFALKKGEILGIGGLTDSGMHDLGRTVFGLEKCEKGSVYLSSSSEKIQSPQKAIRHKIGYVSKNRDKESILNQSNIMDNICLPSYDKIKQGIYIAPKAEKNLAEQESNVLKIKMSSLKQLCGQLSGGNKQKVALAKWLGNELMDDYRKEGKSILMISEELPELIGMSDRILILKDGMISKEFDRSRDLTESEAIKYMI